MRALLDLILPVECGGCGAPGTSWCDGCRRLLADVPIEVHTRVDTGVEVWALGPYSGPRRRAVIAAKERGRRDLADPLGRALSGALGRLRRWGELDPAGPLVLVPAPSRPRAARGRGGDPVLRAAQVAATATGGCRVVPALTMRVGVRDSVGLSAARRQQNLAGRIRFTAAGTGLRRGGGEWGSQVVLVDDVVTTGATVAESVRVLASAGVAVTAALVVAAA
ncbi:ComF family protein [Prescottella sp. R16]|uniref:ComF family protein n=1 Tax=Prescottella sp. R16 TaxID=3064529 RepID=UPI00272DE295|nr:phosphoribosyltransferase family protein [Prescottella sp. R16]